MHRNEVMRYRGTETTQVVLDHLDLTVTLEADLVDGARAAIERAAVSAGLTAPDILIETLSGDAPAPPSSGLLDRASA